MHHQTQTPQIFTVFGSYPIGPQGDYFPSAIGRSECEDCRAITKSGSVKAFMYPACEDQEIHP